MGELGSVAVGVLFVLTRRVITIPLRGSEAYLGWQVSCAISEGSRWGNAKWVDVRLGRAW